MISHHSSLGALKTQAGFLLPVALFLILGAAALAVSISRSSGSLPLIAVQEIFSQQALQAADSGANFGLSYLLMHPSPSRSHSDGLCRSLSGSRLEFDSPGLKNCVANVSCGLQSSSKNDASYYTVTSQGQCGDAPNDGSRTVAVSAYLPGEPMP